MHANDLFDSRRAEWEKLEKLLKRTQNGVRVLSSDEAEMLGQLYRAATSDLALAQRDFPQHKVAQYLNQLVARAHAVVYHGEPLAYHRLLNFVREGFPRTYRQAWPFRRPCSLSSR